MSEYTHKGGVNNGKDRRCKTMKLIIDIPDTNYQWIKEHNKGIILPITRHLYEGVRKGIPLDDFLKRRKEPIDESVVESYLKENEQ